MEARIYKESPEAETGEIQVRGENVMVGYYKNPEATNEVFTEDGWLRTGDLGTMDANGNIFIRGRLKTMILSSSGQNIFPEELETKLNNLPFILESLVIEYNKKLVALVYADYEALDSLGLNNPDNLKTIMDENLKNLNNSVAAYEKISKIQLYPILLSCPLTILQSSLSSGGIDLTLTLLTGLQFINLSVALIIAVVSLLENFIYIIILRIRVLNNSMEGSVRERSPYCLHYCFKASYFFWSSKTVRINQMVHHKR